MENTANRKAGYLAAAAALLTLLTVSAWLRFHALGDPSLWLDEILHFDIATRSAANRWWVWLTAFDPENGPLFYATQLASRAITARPETSARLAPAFFGVLSVAALFAAARAARDSLLDGLATAALAAVSPLAVYYAREGRPYSLLILEASLLMFLILIARSRPVAWYVFAISLAAAWTSATAIPLLAGTSCAALAATAVEPDGRARRRLLHSFVAIAAATALSIVLYSGGQLQRFPTAEHFDVDASFALQLMRYFTVTALHPQIGAPVTWLAAVLFVAGAAALRRRPAGLAAIGGMTVFPFAATLASLVLLHHRFAIRYLITSLPGFLILVSLGAGSVARLARKLPARAVPPIAALVHAGLIALLAMPALSASAREPYEKPPWRSVAVLLSARSREGDVILTTNAWSAVSLSFYLRLIGARLPLFDIRELPARGDRLVATNRSGWIVAAGFHRDYAIRGWACSFPLVLSDPRENLSIRYFPGVPSWISTHAGEAERQHYRRLFFDVNNGWIGMGTDDALFLGSGWEGPDRGDAHNVYRWIRGTEASLLLPSVPPGGVFRFRAAPLDVPGAPPQTFRIQIGAAISDPQPMKPGWNDYAVALPAAGSPHLAVLSIRMSRATAPATISSSGDRRTLSAAVDWIEITTSQRRGRENHARFRIMGSDVLAIEQSNEPLLPDRPLRWRPSAVARMIDLLGFDGQRETTVALRDRRRMEALLHSLLDDPECLSDVSFLERAYESLLGRELDGAGRSSNLIRLQNGASRAAVLRRILRSDEFALTHFM